MPAPVSPPQFPQLQTRRGCAQAEAETTFAGEDASAIRDRNDALVKKKEMDFDELLMRIAAEHQDMNGVLDTFFGFLHRRTDFYVVDPSPERLMGFAPGAAKEMVCDDEETHSRLRVWCRIFAHWLVSCVDLQVERSFRKYPFIDRQHRPVNEKGEPLHPQRGEAQLSNASEPAKPTSDDASTPAAAVHSGAGGENKPADTAGPVRWTEEGKQVPVGNGGVGRDARYWWTQTLRDVTVVIPVEPSTRGKDVDWNIASSHMRIGPRASGSSAWLEGDFPHPVHADECVWSLHRETDRPAQVVLVLDKAMETWWPSVTRGEPEIDTTLVDSTRPITDYDEETQKAIQNLVAEQLEKRRQEGGGDA